MSAFTTDIARPKRRSDEADLQMAVVQLLRLSAVPECWWEGVDAGVYVSSIRARKKRKDMGIRRGSPDLHFVLADGRAAYIELKSKTGVLSPDQKAFMSWCVERGVPHAVCTNFDQVKAALLEWGVLRGVH